MIWRQTYLDGRSVTRVERLEDGTRRVYLITADGQARAFPRARGAGHAGEGLRADSAPAICGTARTGRPTVVDAFRATDRS